MRSSSHFGSRPSPEHLRRQLETTRVRLEEIARDLDRLAGHERAFVPPDVTAFPAPRLGKKRMD